MKKITTLALPILIVALLFVTLYLVLQPSGVASSAAFARDQESSTEQAGPQWYNELWHYRLPVIISNSSGQSLDDYQVLIKLDNSNFDFTKANAGGSDVRFTADDGITERSYWIESWNNGSPSSAYIWVKIPHQEIGDTTVYLYYKNDNPAVDTTSNGLATFDFFDDNWSQFTPTGGGCTVDIPWDCVDGEPTVSSGKLVLTDTTGISSSNHYLYKAVGYRADFGLSDGLEWGGFIYGASGARTMIRDLPPIPPGDDHDLYLQDYVSGYDNKRLERVGSNDWHGVPHVFEIRWRNGQSVGDIDHGASIVTSTLSAQVPGIELPVSFYSFIGSNATLWVDWVYVRQYKYPEPIATINKNDAQGLVDLGITTVDTPDPSRKGIELTYQLTISNTSTIAAPGVVVMDTLPEYVSLAWVDPACYSQHVGEVLCSVDPIPANSAARISIGVIPTRDGWITNTAIVASPSFEMDVSNNTSQAVTLVDSVPPDVNWVKPVQEEDSTYFSNGGLIILEASATDNNQISQVKFTLWDHLWNNREGHYIDVGTAIAVPYQVTFDSDMLKSGEIYQMFVKAYDRAGNESDRKRIFIVGPPHKIFMPLTVK